MIIHQKTNQRLCPHGFTNRTMEIKSSYYLSSSRIFNWSPDGRIFIASNTCIYKCKYSNSSNSISGRFVDCCYKDTSIGISKDCI